MRDSITCIVIFLACITWGLLGLLFPIVLYAQALVEEPFVCAGVYDEDRLSADKHAKMAKLRPSRLTALVVFARFADEAPEDSLSPPYAADLFDPDRPGSLSHFYHHMSFGQFQIEGTVLPKRYASLHNASYYVPSDTSVRRGHFGLFNREILQQVDREVDFGRFDNDGPDGIPNSGDDDGYADVVFINLRSVVEGFFGGTGTGIASLGLGEPYVTEDPSASGGFIQIRDGVTERVKNFAHAVGVMAHELGHWLGLPDLYDTSSWTEVPPEEDSAGIGNWGLMGRGALGWHGNDGPVPFSAWSREQLGWIGERNADLVVVDRPMRDVVIEDVEEGGKVYKMPICEGEYFLIEHRRASGGYYDRNIPKSGLLIWHVGEGTTNEDEQRKRVDLECADGLYLDRGYPDGTVAEPNSGGDNLDFWAHDAAYRDVHRGNLGDATDAFDGIVYRAFEPNTNPSTAAGNSTYTGHRVEHIRTERDRMMADLMPGPCRPTVFLGSIEDGSSEGTSGDGDGVMDPGEIVHLYVELVNRGHTATLGVQAALRAEDRLVTMVDSTAEYGDLFPGDRVGRRFQFAISRDAPAFAHGVVFMLEIRDRWNHQWREAFTRRIGAGVALSHYELLDRSTDPKSLNVLFGNGDAVVNPGELVGIEPLFHRVGSDPFRPSAITLHSDDPFVRNPGGEPLNQYRRLEGNGSDAYSIVGKYFRVLVAPEAPDGHTAHLFLTIADKEMDLGEDLIRLEIRGNDNTPPRVEWVEHSPERKVFDVGDEVTINGKFYGGERPPHVYLKVVTAPDGREVARLEMGDDGRHDDQRPDDGVYGIRWTFPLESLFVGSIVAEDDAGNRSETRLGFGWSSVSFDVKTSVLLLDWIPPDSQSVYADALHAMDLSYDLWNVYYIGTRNVAEVLPHYVDGLVIVAPNAPFDRFLYASYLEAGGHILLAHPSMRWARSFAQKYVYAQTTWSVPPSSVLEGVPDDPITDGLPPIEPDVWFALTPTWPATSIVNDDNGVSYGVKVHTDTYRAVVLGFYVDDMENTKIRRTLLHRILRWLMPSTVSIGPYEVEEFLPTAYALHPNAPNPFNPLTRIRYEVPVNGRVALYVYDILGQKIRTLTSGPHNAGSYTVTWDGTDEEGKAVGSGVYLYHLVAEGFRSTGRMALVR